MLVGERVVLRGITAGDVPTLERWLADPQLWQLVSATPPAPRDAATAERRWLENSPDVVQLAVQAGPLLVGVATAHGIDLHNRSAELGIWLGDQAARGNGYGAEALELMIDYCFRLRGIHRLVIETLADNAAMRRLAERSGFRWVGTLRENAWVNGAFVDSVIYDRLVSD